MLRVGAGLSGIDRAVQHQAENAFNRLTESSLKLATLKRINRGRDDPAGLIAAEQLHRELKAIEEATASTERSGTPVVAASMPYTVPGRRIPHAAQFPLLTVLGPGMSITNGTLLAAVLSEEFSRDRYQ